MHNRNLKRRLPGLIATGLVIITTSGWIFWSFGEMYYEGWWGAWTNRLPYLVPGLVCLGLTVLVLTWPRLGGWVIIAIGGGFTGWWWWRTAVTSGLTIGNALSMLPVSGMLVVTGILFIMEGRYRAQAGLQRATPNTWFRRNIRYILALGLPLLIAIGISIFWLPVVLSRADDGNHDARLIQGNGVNLIWAPAGPGWSEGIGPSHEAGYLLPDANLSWNEIAFYGVPPVGFEDKPGLEDRDATIEDMNTTGLCCYLSEDGLTIMDEPQYIWRMPTVDEMVRSLCRNGENAGCVWAGKSDHAVCRITPDKETPLWVPDWSPIYYWAADEYDEHEAYYVNYRGSIISYQSKSWGNSRHGYRFVRAP